VVVVTGGIVMAGGGLGGTGFWATVRGVSCGALDASRDVTGPGGGLVARGRATTGATATGGAGFGRGRVAGSARVVGTGGGVVSVEPVVRGVGFSLRATGGAGAGVGSGAAGSAADSISVARSGADSMVASARGRVDGGRSAERRFRRRHHAADDAAQHGAVLQGHDDHERERGHGEAEHDEGARARLEPARAAAFLGHPALVRLAPARARRGLVAALRLEHLVDELGLARDVAERGGGHGGRGLGIGERALVERRRCLLVGPGVVADSIADSIADTTSRSISSGGLEGVA
jgi:hypothetical protein